MRTSTIEQQGNRHVAKTTTIERGKHRDRRGAQLLAQALRRTKLTTRVQPIFEAHPVTRVMMERLCYFNSDMILHATGIALNHLCLRDAYAWYKLARDQDISIEDPRCAAAFIAGAMRSEPYLIELSIKGRSGEWNPLAGEPLLQWFKSNLPATVERVDPGDELGLMTPRKFRAALLLQLLSPDEIRQAGGDMAALIDYPLDA
jgi:hypothetical protein